MPSKLSEREELQILIYAAYFDKLHPFKLTFSNLEFLKSALSKIQCVNSTFFN